MANRASRARDKDIRLSESQMRHPGMENVARGGAPDSSSKPSELAEEYRYVVTDLRRIGVIAAVMLAALVGLAFFLA